jgi:hypothetical protein
MSHSEELRRMAKETTDPIAAMMYFEAADEREAWEKMGEDLEVARDRARAEEIRAAQEEAWDKSYDRVAEALAETESKEVVQIAWDGKYVNPYRKES